MKSVIVFDGIQLIALAVFAICCLFLVFAFLLDAYFRKHPHSRFRKIADKIFGVKR